MERDQSIVRIATGEIRGIASDGIIRFLGVPYAAAPVGDLRFAAPQPHAPWDGIRDATESGPNAPHLVKPFPGLDVAPLIGTGWARGDDYLSVNVWTPDPAAKGLPVMVFIHGGAFVLGSKDASVHDGSGFAKAGMVCIAINYRLGIDGFLPIPGIPTNLGLRDQIAALKWVRENAAAFGGDGGNITVFGESAGAMSIGNLIASPLAQGLFRRAIVQSGHGSMTREIGVMQRLVKKLAKMLGVSPDAEGFRSVSYEDGLIALEKISQPTARIDLRDSNGREPLFGLSRFSPVHGDDLLPEPALDLLAKGAGADVELLIGTNAEEMNLYLVPTGVREKIGKWLAIYALHKSHPNARKTLRAYGMGSGKKPGQAFTDALNDLVFRWPARRFAEEHRGRTHMYEFEWRSPQSGGELGACHGIELGFVFDTLASVTGPEGLAGEAPPQELADRTHKLWVDFARDGVLPWGEFDREGRLVYQLAAGSAVREAQMAAAAFQA
ncbi:carboxylesterase family protein [Sphingomonas sp. G-3-2-10]|uniref:carboxylesterase/lipase family protein n=1 Tax=Sphingomonas sp. G-3-2-10 TaxID=2728838 RepID=UPI00146E2AFC|nr:carboxylesterase family protein [Sphingomonas sp. G-3-2-10]NML05493.1 carboxylesterase family protein [Sphingomonas sp. G-3-2-10]